MARAESKGIIPVHIQHIADPAQGLSPFFNEGTHGADIKAAAPVVVKHYADGFHQTNLEAVLSEHNSKKLLVWHDDSELCHPYRYLKSSRKVRRCYYFRSLYDSY